MQQYQAGYILESVSKELKELSKDNATGFKVSGLLQSLSTFDVQTSVNLKFPKLRDSLLSVAHNIITRGLPTFPSEFIETQFANQLSFTMNENDFGTISYPLKKDFQTNDFRLAIFEALHIIDPRHKSPAKFLSVDDTDSDFEKAFLFNIIPTEKSYLTQLFQHQRKRATLGAPVQNQGRVDFSCEIPYAIATARQNRFNRQVWVKYKKSYIVEIDGSNYHTDFIDDIKDFEVSELRNNIHHIREGEVNKNVNEFLARVCSEDYIAQIDRNFKREISSVRDVLSLVLSPIAVARFQRVIIQYLLCNIERIIAKNATELKIAVIERDVPFAFIGWVDLEALLKNLFSLAGIEYNIPQISIEVFSSEEFISSPLHIGGQPKKINSLHGADFDLTVDISMLWRSGIFKLDNQADLNSVIIVRSSHFVHPQTVNEVVCAPLVKYQEVTIALANEQHELVPGIADSLRYFLRTLFRKEDFRDGQLPILNRAIQLRSVIGLLPTGGGKSLTYQLASMLQPGITVVIDPIRSLMLDQYNGLRKIGIDKCEFINSTLSQVERGYNQKKLLAKGLLQFVYVSPERFVIEEFRKTLTEANQNGFYFSYAVIDEVHCVSEWGHDFRTPYLNLGSNAIEFCTTFSKEVIPLFGLTATASFDVLADIERELRIPSDDGNAIIRYENTIRDEINYSIREISGDFANIQNINSFNVKDTIAVAKMKESFRMIRQVGNELKPFNNEGSLRIILSRTYTDYLPEIGRPSLDSFVKKWTDRLLLPAGSLTANGIDKTYNYGAIVFCPHRNGALGVRAIYEAALLELVGERPGYFMGSGEDEDSDRIDQESFKHLEDFVSNQESIMIATKAFGMGIDKANVRMTIHINIPQSIESFVQEAGRAGRDKRISHSAILYNKQIFNLNNKAFQLDMDVLMYFHKNSFKGEIKERQVIHELRTKITFPNTTRINQIQEYVNELFPSDQRTFILQVGRNNWENFLFVKTSDDLKVGSLNISNREISVRNEYGSASLAHDVLNVIFTQIPFSESTSTQQIRFWLQSYVADTTSEIGIETALNEMVIGERRKIQVPFTNRYYSKRTRIRAEFILNENHNRHLTTLPLIQQLNASNDLSSSLASVKLKDAIYGGLTFEEFIDSLAVTNPDVLSQLRSDLSLQRAYYIPRSQGDTAKSLYRLISIGIIDSYTIDYQNNLYTVAFTKKEKEDYFKSLQILFERYTSQKTAESKIGEVKVDFDFQSQINNATVISTCLKYLTDFVYNKIADKRIQAINDMIDLCDTAIQFTDPIKQSAEIRDAIYYYFNAKYSRRGNEAIVNDLSVAASMPDDRLQLDDLMQTIHKYLDLMDNDNTGEFKNNVKHLRGSTMRMLRSYPAEPHYLILKSYSLFVLSGTIVGLIDEGKRELVKGLISWKQIEDTLNIASFIEMFKARINKHVDNDRVDIAFDAVEDEFYSLYHSQWLRKFNLKIITTI